MLETFLVSFSTLLAIVDPLASIGPFLAMTESTADRRKEIALRAVLVATAVLLFSAFAGSSIFSFYGITLPALKISGGVLLFVIAFDMLYARPTRSKSTKEEEDEGVLKEDVAVFPLAVPLLAGPGAILSVFIFMDRAKEIPQKASVIGAILITMIASLMIFWFAGRLARLLGAIGVNIFTRLMGLVLAAISVQFIIDGVHEAFPKMLG